MSKEDEKKQPVKPAEKKDSPAFNFGKMVEKIVKAPKMPKEKKE